MISPLMVSSKNTKVSQHCLETSTESFTGSSPSEQIIVYRHQLAERFQNGVTFCKNFVIKVVTLLKFLMTSLQTKNNQGAARVVY